MMNKAPHPLFMTLKLCFVRNALKQFLSLGIVLSFLVNSLGPIPIVQAQGLKLPAPGFMVRISPPLNPPMLKGLKVYPDNPLRFDFILDKGDSSPSLLQRGNKGELKQLSTKLIKYFLASLTIPENDLWVTY